MIAIIATEWHDTEHLPRRRSFILDVTAEVGLTFVEGHNVHRHHVALRHELRH